MKLRRLHEFAGPGTHTPALPHPRKDRPRWNGRGLQAEDTKLGRYVAIKLLPADATEDATAKRRLLNEAQSASALNHPHIVTIHAIEEVNGLDFIVMEYVEGETLKALIDRSGALPLTTLLDVGIQVADALEAAHAIGLIHRDIKPANILITPRGIAKLADFGLATTVRPRVSKSTFNRVPPRKASPAVKISQPRTQPSPAAPQH